MKICSFCGNKNFNKIVTQYTYKRDGKFIIIDDVPCQSSYKRDGKFIIIDDVPCQSCEYCGEQYFEAKILKNIEAAFNNIYSKGKKIKRSITIPIESYSELLSA